MQPNSEVVVGVDGSPGSSSAVQWAAHAAAHQRGLLAVVHVSDLPNSLWPQSRTVRSELRELTRPLVDVAREIAACAEPALPVRSEVLVGPPWRQLAALSAQAGLVAVGRSGRSRALATMLGSTPSRLAARTECPLVVVPAAAAWPPERIVVAVGALPADRELLRYGTDLADSLDLPLIPVHVAAGGEATPQLPNLRVLDGRHDRELVRVCGTGDLLIVGVRPARIAVAKQARYRQILDEAHCPVVLVPLARPAEASSADTTGVLATQLDGCPRTAADRPGRCHRSDRRCDDLAPSCTSSRATRRRPPPAASWATKQWAPCRASAPECTPSSRATGCWSRASPPAVGAATAGSARTASAAGVAAGYSVT